VLTGRNASEARVGETARGGRVLHFATHAVVLDERPQASFLALSTPWSSKESRPSSSTNAAAVLSLDPADGRLTADEVYGLSLEADLVVLSACRTGLGALSGDGMIGLTRAFLVAGSRSIVASLWDVADEPAAQLMPAFYKAWLAGEAKSEALRRAQLGLLRALRAGRVVVGGPRGPQPLPEHPVFWATFVLTGDP
jgi:CHAT domain-containing protein